MITFVRTDHGDGLMLVVFDASGHAVFAVRHDGSLYKRAGRMWWSSRMDALKGYKHFVKFTWAKKKRPR